MNRSFPPRLYLALIHHPVINKNGEVIASALTNLDLHDIARAVTTYGVKGFYVVTPLEDQQEMATRIISHWTKGVGARYNPIRKQALASIRIRGFLEEAVSEISRSEAAAVQTVATTARTTGPGLGYGQLRQRLETGRPHLLMLGTAWGLAPEVLEAADVILDPVRGATDYNHLSVRSAASIMLDRLLGPEDRQ